MKIADIPPRLNSMTVWMSSGEQPGRSLIPASRLRLSYAHKIPVKARSGSDPTHTSIPPPSPDSRLTSQLLQHFPGRNTGLMDEDRLRQVPGGVEDALDLVGDWRVTESISIRGD